MNRNVVVPSIGESINQGVLVAWLKQNGDYVEEGDSLFELETEKATMAIPAPCQGYLTILVEAGSEVKIGQTVASIANEAPAASPAKTPTDHNPTPPSQVATDLPLSPAVRKLVDDHHLTPHEIVGSGKAGRILKGDVIASLDQAVTGSVPPPAPMPAMTSSAPKHEGAAPTAATFPPPPPRSESTPQPTTPATSPTERQTRVKMTMLRRTIAERLLASKQQTAMLTTFNEINMGEVMRLRDAYKELYPKKHGVKLGMMSFFVKAVVRALQEFPVVNAMIEGDDVVYNNFYDIGVAVSTDRGLMVPIIRGADQLDFAGIEKKIQDLSEKARTKRLALEEMSGGTFTITNGGVFGSLFATPIINPPQTAILGMHAVQRRPIAVGDEVKIAPMMYVALSYDHRLIDGRDSVTFLFRIKELVEHPERLMLDI
jgi:2-oxoglutarate dehydrogenase E2 component (dihydrolipoamide succinyltransferase)